MCQTCGLENSSRVDYYPIGATSPKGTYPITGLQHNIADNVCQGIVAVGAADKIVTNNQAHPGPDGWVKPANMMGGNAPFGEE